MKIFTVVFGIIFLLLLWGVLYVFVPQLRVGLYNAFTPPRVVQTLECGDVKVEKVNDPTKYIDPIAGFYSVEPIYPGTKTRIVNPDGESVTIAAYANHPEILGDGVVWNAGWGEVPVPYDKTFSEYEITHSISINEKLKFSDLIKPGTSERTAATPSWNKFRTGSGAAYIGFKRNFLTEKEFQALQSCSGFKELMRSTLVDGGGGGGGYGRDIFFYLQAP